MSDFQVSAGLELDASFVAEQLSWMPCTRIFRGVADGLSWMVTRVDDPILWSPAYDEASGTRVIVAGRIAFDESEWLEAERQPYEGGLAARLILARWLKGKVRIEEGLNGGGLTAIICERTRKLYLWTDRLGFYPCFAWTGGGFIIGSHADVIAATLRKARRSCQFDPLTMAEFLQTGTATQPHTYWSGIEQLEPGTRYEFVWGEQTTLKGKTQYWLPAYFDQPYLEDRCEIVERLTDALTSAVRKRTLDRLGKVALLLSSGADSRVALFAARDPSMLTCFTYYDEPNQELRGAKLLAEAAGATHIAYQRSTDYYFEHADRAVRVSGGMWSIESAHHSGLLHQLHASGYGTVLSGCYADYLLKGIVYNRKPRTLLGRPIPIQVFSPFEYQWHHPHCVLASPWAELVEKRLATRLFDKRAPAAIDRSEIEYRRLAPIIREPDASGRLQLRRCTSLDVFMSDNAVLDLFGRICPREKLNGIPFGMAVSRIAGKRGRQVMNNNYSAPVGANELQRVAAFVKASLARKLRGEGSGQPYDRDPRSVASVASWPHFPNVVKLSERLSDWHASQPMEQREFLFQLMGKERRSWSVAQWADKDVTLFIRYHTASLWLTQQPHALSSYTSRGEGQ